MFAPTPPAFTLVVHAVMVAPMKSREGIKSTNGMKSMTAKKSKIARGVKAKPLVLNGQREQTVGRLTKDALTKNRSGKIVYKKKSRAAKRKWPTSALNKWGDAVKAARAALNITRFVTVNGKTAQGKALYAKAKALHTA